MGDTWRLIGPDGKPYLSDQPGTLGGHRRSRVYGRLDCPAALRAIARGGYVAHRVFFLNAAHACAAGYRPCAVCMPRAYAAWKSQATAAPCLPTGGGTNMQKQQLLDKIDKTWTELHDAYAGLSEAQMTEPGVGGEWSVQDILAHVTTWEEEALAHLPTILAGKTPPRYSVTHGGVDAFNAQMVERNRSRSLAETLAQLEEVHRRLVAYVAAAPADQIASETRFRRRLRFDSYRHYPTHAKTIREWREQRGY